MPPPGNRAYQQSLASARRQFFENGVPASALQRLYRTYASMLADITADLERNRITPDRARAIRQSVRLHMRRLMVEAPVQIADGIDEGIQASIASHREGALAAAAADGGDLDPATLDTAFANVPDNVLRQSAARRGLVGAANFKTLVERHALAAADAVDEAIVSAVGRGASRQRLSTTIAKAIARGGERPSQQLIDALEDLGPRGGLTLDALSRDVSLDDFDPSVLDDARKLLNRTDLIATNEINMHYDEADAVSMARSPVVDIVRWRTSTIHDSLDSSPDMCDVLETQDLYGYGPGLYHKQIAPSRPHPRCMCPKEAVTLPPEEYGNDERPIPEPPQLTDEQVRRTLESLPGDRTITDAYVRSQRKRMQDAIDAIHSNRRRSFVSLNGGADDIDEAPDVDVSPQEKWNETLNAAVSSHEDFLADAPEQIVRAIAATDPITVVRDRYTKKTAHFEASRRDASAIRYNRETNGAPLTWAHEYGHYVDWNRGALRDSEFQTMEYTDTMLDDYKRLFRSNVDRRERQERARQLMRERNSVLWDTESLDDVDAQIDAWYDDLPIDRATVEGFLDEYGRSSRSQRFETLIDLSAAIEERSFEEILPLLRPFSTDAVDDLGSKFHTYTADFFGALTRNKVGFGHRDSYYKDSRAGSGYIRENQALEMFANYFAMRAFGNRGTAKLSLALFRLAAPQTIERFDAFIDVVVGDR